MNSITRWRGNDTAEKRIPGKPSLCRKLLVLLQGSLRLNLFGSKDRDVGVYLRYELSKPGGKNSITRTPLSTVGSRCLATKSPGEDLNAAQTRLNEKLLEVNICLSCVCSVMCSNYEAAGCWVWNMKAVSHQKTWLIFPPPLSRLRCCILTEGEDLR